MAIREPLPPLLTIDDVAEQLGITPRHIRCLVAERRIPFLKVGWFVRFDPDDIARWLDTRRRDVAPARTVPGRRRPVLVPTDGARSSRLPSSRRLPYPEDTFRGRQGRQIRG